MKAVRIRTEHLSDPIGIDVKHPKITWNCEGGKKQSAYQFVSKQWDSGKVSSDTMCVEYPLELSSRERVEFRIRLWDENDQEEFSETAFFEMGLLDKNDWKAEWITGDYVADDRTDKKNNRIGKNFALNGLAYVGEKIRTVEIHRYPVDCFKKEFSIGKKVKQARLYITACGLYEAHINHRRVGDFVLAPGLTDYRRRIQYQTYDVTELLETKANIMTIDLADGWYRGSVGAWGLLQEYGSETKVLAQLEITYADDTKDTVITDQNWSWSNDGPIRFADNKDGEIVDANLVPSYHGKAKVTKHNVVPSASNNVCIKEHERLKAELIITPKGEKILDFKQNFAGYIEFEIDVRKGQKITLRFGEMLDQEGEFTQRNIQVSTKTKTSPLQKIEYTCKEGKNRYKTRFAVFGYQYVLIDSDIEIDPKDFTGIAVYSDLERTGYFDSSNELLNRFVEATVWSTKSNSPDSPTDCPTRERHAWSGDAQIFFNSASYLFDYASFSKKYLNDIYDWQKKNGKLPQIAPEGGVDFYMTMMDGSVGWADVGIIMPYQHYRKYKDSSILEKYYDGMTKYADFMISRIGKNALLSHKNPVKGEDRKFIVNAGQAYGEWAEPEDVYPNNWTNVVMPEMEVSTAYTSYVLKMMAEISALLGKEKDHERFLDYSEKCKKAYQRLRETEEFTLDTDRQARLVRPLYMDLLNEKQAEYAKKRLIEAMEHYQWRLGTGFLSTPMILYVLSEIDKEYAYKLLENEEIPGWLAMPKNGATTIWESWEGTSAQNGIASLNHYSKGAACEWLFKEMCGIHVGDGNHFVIKPLPGGHFTYAKAEYLSVYGQVRSFWEKTAKGYEYEIEIPANCTADIILPDGKTYQQEAGTKKYKSS
ncbi:MAG: family 78 glycoside hydrolase catalytic domain [Erysipelotrichaceae bacterium]|nr:family 78 glycoside hydrolase catalytic domain [Erysipelotrichaceae bacterium]